jgi:pilus assembly protein CpaE
MTVQSQRLSLSAEMRADAGTGGAALTEGGDAPLIPVPSITLAAFAETVEGLAMFRAAQGEARMARVTMRVEGGGLKAARAAYAEAISPPVLILETAAPAAEMLADLEALAEVCDPQTRVILIGSENDIDLYRDLMRRGISDYLHRPVSAARVIRALADLTVQPGTARMGHVHAFIAASGGAGSSTLALNTAWAIGHRRRTVVSLLDLDLDFGTAGVNLALDGPKGLVEALQAGARLDGQMLDGLMQGHDAHLRILTAPEASGLCDEPGPEVLDHLIDLARAGAAQVVLDLPDLRFALTRRAVLNADQVVITATPDLASLKHTRKVLDLLAGLRGAAAAPLVVLNKTGIARRPEISAKDFAATLGITLTATVAFDPKGFGTACNLGKVHVATARGRGAAKALEPLVRALAGGAVPRVAGRAGEGRGMAGLMRLMRRG